SAAMGQLDLDRWGPERGGPGTRIDLSSGAGAAWRRPTRHGGPSRGLGESRGPPRRASPRRAHAAGRAGRGEALRGGAPGTAMAQSDHVTVDNRVPYYVYGNKRDGPSDGGASNGRTGRQIGRSEWHGVQGGECGWATRDPVDSNIVWSTASGSGSRGGIVIRFDARRRQGQNVEVYPLSTGGTPAADVKYRFIWDAPFAISPHDHNKVYTGSQFVHMSTDGGRSWRVISPDLTRNDKSKQQISGGLTPDDIGVEYGDVVYAIAESRLTPGLIWVGTNDGLVQVTRNGGTTWTNVTANV